MSNVTPLGRATLVVMGEDMARWGLNLTQRRARHRLTVSEVERRTGMNRKTIARAEAGEASSESATALDLFYDQEDELAGIDSRVPVPVPQDQENVEFDVTGPRTDWHVVVRGPADLADELRRQVVELLKDIEPEG